MTTSAKLSGVVLFSGLDFAGGSAGVSAEEAASCHVAPLQGITLTVGSKRAVSYYTANAEKACNLTLLLPIRKRTRLLQSRSGSICLTVREGTSARVDSLEGSLSFACAPAATAMIIQPIQRVAYTATAK